MAYFLGIPLFDSDPELFTDSGNSEHWKALQVGALWEGWKGFVFIPEIVVFSW